MMQPDIQRERQRLVRVAWGVVGGISLIMFFVGILVSIESGIDIGNITTGVVCVVPGAILLLVAALIYYFFDYRQR